MCSGFCSQNDKSEVISCETDIIPGYQKSPALHEKA